MACNGIRRKVICHLEEIFYIASDYARGRIYRVATEDRKVRPLTIAERCIWARVSKCTIMMLGDVRNGIDERQLEEALSKLETIVDQAATSEKVDKTALGQQKGASDNQQVNVYLLQFFSLFKARINIKILGYLKAVFAFIGKVFSVVVI